MSKGGRMEGGGTLLLREDGPRIRFEAVRPDDGQGLYKAWVLGEEGELLLGTLIPEGDGLRLTRTVSRSALERAGCWPVTGGRAVLCFPVPGQGERGSAWAPEPNPGRLCRDALLRESLWGQPGFCSRSQGELRLLSAPLRSGQPFPLPILFCLAKVELREGRPWLVWSFDREGNPVPPA